jgi:MFS transporter, DHA2 family, multidrug resistance protein
MPETDIGPRSQTLPKAETADRFGRVVTATGLMMATALQAADALIVNVALPQLEHDLGGGLELGAWVMTSYLCATAVMAPLTGWLRRRYGPQALFRSAVLTFITASLLCGLASSGPEMIALRVLQGASGGVILPLAQALLLDLYPPERHGRLLAIWGAVLMTGPVLGPPLGGILTDLASWRAVFVINVPLGLLIIAVVRHLGHRESTAGHGAIDGVGILLLMAAVGALQLCLERGIGRSWLNSPELITEGVIASTAFGLLALRAWRFDFSVFRLDVFRDVNFTVAAVYNFLTSGMVFIVVVFLPALSEGPLDYTATLAGFTIMPRAVLLMLMMLVVGELVGRIPYRLLLSSGWIFMASGFAILSQIQPTNGMIWLVIGSTVQAIGAGLLFTPHSTLAFSTLAPDLRTEASGLYSLLRQLGFAFSVALMTAVLRTRIDANMSGITALLASPGDGSLSVDAVNTVTLQAYKQCFEVLSLVSLLVIPGVLLFRFSGAKGGNSIAPSEVPHSQSVRHHARVRRT